jgi:hypothetical protein
VGEVLQAGGSVRIRPLEGGNETQVLAPEGGEFVVKGLESGNYVATDELGNQRAFSVTQGPGEEVTLETFASAEEREGQDLPANYGTEAPLVADESGQIQHGIAPMRQGVREDGSPSALLEREDVDPDALDTAPPTIPGPDNSGPTEEPAPSAEVTDEAAGASSDAIEETGARQEGGDGLNTGASADDDLPAGVPEGADTSLIHDPPAAGNDGDGQLDTPVDSGAQTAGLSTTQLIEQLRSDKEEGPSDEAVLEELRGRSANGDEVAGQAVEAQENGTINEELPAERQDREAKEAAEAGSDVPPQDDPEFEAAQDPEQV